MNKKPPYALQKVGRHQNSFKGYVNPNSCFSPSRKHSGHFPWVRNRRIYRWIKALQRFLERNRILTKAKAEEMNGVESGDDSTPRGRAALQGFGDDLNLHFGSKELMMTENAKLALSALAILLLQILCSTLKQKLLIDTQYGDDLHAFPPYTDFLGFVNSVGACVVALLYYAIKRKPLKPRAPLCAYIGIGCCVAIAMVSSIQLEERFTKEISSAVKSLVVLCVLGMQRTVLQVKFKRRTWVHILLFTAVCVVTSIPWAGTVSPIYVENGGSQPTGMFWSFPVSVAFLLLFVLGEGLSQSFQDRLYLNYSMSVADQTLYIFLVVGAVNLIGWLVGKHLGVIAGFVVDHPTVLVSLTLSALPVAGKLYLMSYMLKLCGALTCAMVHQVMVAVLVLAESGVALTWRSSLQWIGTATMVLILRNFLEGPQSHNHSQPSLPAQLEGEMKELRSNGVGEEHVALVLES